MPLGIRGHQHGAGRIAGERAIHLGLGLHHGLCLDGLPLPVEAVEVGGDAGGLDRIRRGEEAGAQG